MDPAPPDDVCCGEQSDLVPFSGDVLRLRATDDVPEIHGPSLARRIDMYPLKRMAYHDGRRIYDCNAVTVNGVTYWNGDPACLALWLRGESGPDDCDVPILAQELRWTP